MLRRERVWGAMVCYFNNVLMVLIIFGCQKRRLGSVVELFPLTILFLIKCFAEIFAFLFICCCYLCFDVAETWGYIALFEVSFVSVVLELLEEVSMSCQGIRRIEPPTDEAVILL